MSARMLMLTGVLLLTVVLVDISGLYTYNHHLILIFVGNFMLKASENPPTSWPEDTSIKDFVGTWWVAHTKSRNEKALAWQMLRGGISYFLPMTEKVSSRNGRKLRSFLPLFTGYVFFCASDDQRIEVLQTNRVANLIEVPDQERLVSDLMPIELALRHGENPQPHKYIKAGQKCRVIAGVLMGTEGIAIEDSKQWKLVLQVDMLGQATSVEISADMIELVD